MLFIPNDPNECVNPTWWKSGLTSPLAVTFLYLLVCMYGNCVVQVYAQYRSEKINAETLPDIGFDILPDIHHKWADIWCYGMMGITFVRFCFGFTSDGCRIRKHIFRRHIFCLGTLFLFRAFSIISTLLPNPLLECETDVTGSPFYEAFRIMAGATVTCADVMYSGHTVNITLCAMTWHNYSHVVPIFDWDPLFGWNGRTTNKLGDLERLTTVKLFVWIFAALGYVFIVGSRFHYTLDVFIGLLLTVAIFKYHHMMLRTSHLKKSMFARLISWLEKDSEDLQWYVKYLSKVNDAVVFVGEDGDLMQSTRVNLECNAV